MDILKGFFSNLQSKTKHLNYSKTKSIQIVLDPASLPNIKPVYKLNDHDHGCHITFSKECMNAISEKAQEIKICLRREEEKVFLISNEMKVFSEKMHDQCAVCFLNPQAVRINIMIKTFDQLMSSSSLIALKHDKIKKKVSNISKNLTGLLDTLLAKYDECNVDNPEFNNVLQKLQQTASLLGQDNSTSSNTSTIILNTSNEDENDENDEEEDYNEDDEDDDYDRWGRRHRYGYDDYDEDMEEDDMDYY